MANLAEIAPQQYVELTSGLTVKWAAARITSSGDLVAAVSGKKIRVLFADFHSYDATTTGSWKLQSGASTDLTGAFDTQTTTAAVQNKVWPYNPHGWVETVAGEKLNMVITNVDAVSYLIGYVEV